MSAGASGAIFGVLGATFVIARGELEAVAGQIGFLILSSCLHLLRRHNQRRCPCRRPRRRRPLRPLIVAGEQGRLGDQRRNRLAIELGAMAAIGVLSFILALAVA